MFKKKSERRGRREGWQDGMGYKIIKRKNRSGDTPPHKKNGDTDFCTNEDDVIHKVGDPTEGMIPTPPLPKKKWGHRFLYK